MHKAKSLIVGLIAITLVGCPVSSTPSQPPPPELEVAVEVSESLDALVDRTLQENLERRTLSTETHGAWQILHGVLAYGDRFVIQTPDGSQPAIDYLLAGGTVDGFEPMPGHRFGPPPRRGLKMEMQPSTKVGQGHRDQWLAILAQSGLRVDAKIESSSGTYTIEDWVRQTEHEIPRNLELEFSWTLIALTAYRETSHSWQAVDGRRYDIENLLASEVEQNLAESSCGGTHRLIGMAMALNQRRRENAPLTGVWLTAQQRVNEAVAMAEKNQNADGSFSVAYLHRPGWTRDLGESLGTTGHVLEFLSFAASDETLRAPWVERTVRHLCRLLKDCEGVDLECGVLYHALHGLAEYQSRIEAITSES